MKRFGFWVILVCVSLTGLPVWSASQDEGAQEPPHALLGKQANDFKLDGPKPGSSISLSSAKGKVVVLDFWASWCPPCRRELPVIDALYQTYQSKGVVFFGVNVDQERQAALNLLQKTPLSFPIGLDTDSKVAASYMVEGLPTLFLIGKTGKIERVHVGFREDLKAVLSKDLDALLKGESLLEKKDQEPKQ